MFFLHGKCESDKELTQMNIDQITVKLQSLEVKLIAV